MCLSRNLAGDILAQVGDKRIKFLKKSERHWKTFRLNFCINFSSKSKKIYAFVQKLGQEHLGPGWGQTHKVFDKK